MVMAQCGVQGLEARIVKAECAVQGLGARMVEV